MTDFPHFRHVSSMRNGTDTGIKTRSARHEPDKVSLLKYIIPQIVEEIVIVYLQYRIDCI